MTHKLTEAQRQALTKVYNRPMTNTADDLGTFIDSAIEVPFTDGAYTVPWCGMFLIIEPDGYTHS